MNYAAHAAESGSAPPAQPVVFFKHPNTVVGPFDEVLVPRGAEKVDWVFPPHRLHWSQRADNHRLLPARPGGLSVLAGTLMS